VSRVCADLKEEGEGEKNAGESIREGAEKRVCAQAENGQKREEAKTSTGYSLKVKDDSYEQCWLLPQYHDNSAREGSLINRLFVINLMLKGDSHEER
jgi:hypothetical protein